MIIGDCRLQVVVELSFRRQSLGNQDAQGERRKSHHNNHDQRPDRHHLAMRDRQIGIGITRLCAQFLGRSAAAGGRIDGEFRKVRYVFGFIVGRFDDVAIGGVRLRGQRHRSGFQKFSQRGLQLSAVLETVIRFFCGSCVHRFESKAAGNQVASR